MLKGRDILTLADLTSEEIWEILKATEQLKLQHRLGDNPQTLKGKTLLMVFQKPSTRTRISFEVAMLQLGGHAIYLSWNETQLGRGEPLKDTARVMSRYADAILVRTFNQEDLEKLAENATIPVINGLTDKYHPCQVLSDLYTIYEKKHFLDGLKLAYVGDGNNVCHSLLLGLPKVGMNIAIACPPQHQPDPDVVNVARKEARKHNTQIETYSNPVEAVRDAHIVYTDTWVSMGQEKEEKDRKKHFRGYTVDEKLLSVADEDYLVMHCLPAHRGEEITDKVIEGPHSIVFDQAENRLHTQKAILSLIMG
ncbi:MAG: ornithine carbamoyltransferase [Methanobacteriota archaeon]|nr:MAG: ornithine carbamoyltransferase [Euryarchaeota archaeon]